MAIVIARTEDAFRDRFSICYWKGVDFGTISAVDSQGPGKVVTVSKLDGLE